ncbi:XRE family transcriptional regulator [Ktedonosporobacter rubrisoli]|uniref:XRE family transcriptional regulator n=1 Tax=Ktedonosporobacter rubrisoli TaxID=2509675 RepID=A0A4P6K449_KTERU|nr:helix-turn-helix transcriptional regulator [Ktedonosporobacter rubrisoli]QBD82703.1 XRE family transcriptional regulator [Ktedonosporobacter rubrisoli]
MRERVKSRAGLADFLQSRRARLQPEQFHLPTFQRRRTRGLRREELAQLVGVGVSWYTWLEQGRNIQVSDQVLERLASILQLNAEERHHLFHLAQAPASPLYEQGERKLAPNAAAQAILDGYTYPALLFDDRVNAVGWNKIATRVFGDYASRSERERNAPWFHFMHPSARTFHVNWEREARRCLASLHARYDRDPDDPWLNALIAELQQASPEFRAWWPEHEIVLGCGGLYEMNHPQIGYLVLHPTVFPMPEQPELQMVLYTPLAQNETVAKLQALMNDEGRQG